MRGMAPVNMAQVQGQHVELVLHYVKSYTKCRVRLRVLCSAVEESAARKYLDKAHAEHISA